MKQIRDHGRAGSRLGSRPFHPCPGSFWWSPGSPRKKLEEGEVEEEAGSPSCLDHLATTSGSRPYDFGKGKGLEGTGRVGRTIVFHRRCICMSCVQLGSTSFVRSSHTLPAFSGGVEVDMDVDDSVPVPS